MAPHIRKIIWVSLLVPGLLGGRCEDPIEQLCGDGIDNDEDGPADCDDPDCQNFYDYYGYCDGGDEVCDGGDDEDSDGDTDCEDEDCEDAPECSPDGTGGLDGGQSTGGADGDGGTTPSGGAPSGGSTGGNNESGATGEGGSGEGSDTCPTPIAAQAGPNYSLGELGDFTDFTASSCQADGGGADIALFYVAPTGGSLTASVYATYADLDVSLRSDCDDPDSELPNACTASPSYGASDSITVDVVAEQTVYIIVSGASAAEDTTAYLSLELE